MTAMMTKLGTSPVNADTAAAKSRIKTNGLLNRSIKATSRLFGLAVSIRFGPTALRMAAASDALRPVSLECRRCRSSASGSMARSDVLAPRARPRPWSSAPPAGCGAAALGATERGRFMSLV